MTKKTHAAVPVERRTAAPAPSSGTTRHRFEVGQRLRLVGSGRYWGRLAGVCRVVALMPHDSGPFQYRIRSEIESFERIVAEADLVPVGD